MKTRKLFPVLVLVVVLLLGTVLTASADNKIRVTGGANNTLFGFGWEWINVNFSLDPMTYDASGTIRYMAYEDEYGKEIKLSWDGEVICAALGEFNGLPTVAIVTKIVDERNIYPDWVGKYMKTTVSDGGQNASEDMVGITVWDFENNSPVDYQPSCGFEEPLIWYFSQNGNFTIHD